MLVAAPAAGGGLRGPEVVAQQGLEVTPVGLAYHYVHASLSALGGGDAFGTALPAHFLMLLRLT